MKKQAIIPEPTQMLYRHADTFTKGKSVKVDGNIFDYTVVLKTDVDEALKDGWHKTTQEIGNDTLEFDDTLPGDDDAPTMDELKQKAKELGIKYRSNTRYDTLLKKVTDGLD